jgi:AcrR family transcriptional regulator
MRQLANQPIRQGKQNAAATKRARSMPRAERRKQLLFVAKKIIANDGIGALTMSRIALQSGVSKPVVYEHFPNSEAVAIALLNEYFKEIVELVDSRTKGAETLSEYLSIAIDAQFEFHDKDTLSVRGITNGHSASDELNKTYHQMRKITLNTFQELLLQQGVAQPAARAGGFILADLMASGVLEFATWRNNVTAKEILKRMMIGAIDAIAPPGGSKPKTPARALARSRRLKRLHER